MSSFRNKLFGVVDRRFSDIHASEQTCNFLDLTGFIKCGNTAFRAFTGIFFCYSVMVVGTGGYLRKMRDADYLMPF